MTSHVLTKWEPEDKAFWEKEGKAIASRNLWISIPALLLAFSVWMVWSMVVVNLPNVGFKFDNNQLLYNFLSLVVPVWQGSMGGQSEQVCLL